MNWLAPAMSVLYYVLQIYTLLLIIRIVLTWVSMDHGHPAIRVLHSITDPYLDWFRQFRFLTLGNIDFSPLAALLVINFFSILIRGISTEGQITLGIVLSILVNLLWGAVAFFLLLLGILALVRFFGIRFRWGGPALWAYLDALLQPVAQALGRLLRPGTFLAYTSTLLILGVAGLVVWAAGNLVFGLLAAFLHALPF